MEAERERADIEGIVVDRPFPQGREDPVEGPQVLEQTVMVVRPRLEQRAKDLRAETVLGTGIPVAVAVRVEREAVMQGTVDPVCWFRFWDVIFTGAVVAVDPATPVPVGTAGSAAAAVEPWAQRPAGRA